jgi:Xaa-Pro dipeptidase
MAQGASPYEQRLAAVRDAMEALGVDIVVLADPANVLYLTGYWTILSSMSPQAALISREKVILIIPSLEGSAVGSMRLYGAPLEVVRYHAYPLLVDGTQELPLAFPDALTRVIESFPAARAAADVAALKHFILDLLRSRYDHISDVGPLLLNLRAHKDPGEVRALREAATIVSAAVSLARTHIATGMTENGLAALIAGSVWAQNGITTHIVVGSGPRSALAHPLPTKRLLADGELVLIDVGVLYQGYWAEVARTFVVGVPSHEQIAWHRTIIEAQAAASRKVRPGIEAGHVDAAARDLIHADGFDGRHFTHAVGHGLGLLGMDLPLIAPQSLDLIPPSCALTLEPAIYVAGKGGVRIEDTYLVTAGGVEVLTRNVPGDLTVS